MRETSLAAFQEIQQDGTLGARQKQALEILIQHGPLTGNEVSHKAGLPGLWKRLSELEDLGLVRSVGKRRCAVTGRQAMTWEVTRGDQQLSFGLGA